MNTWYLFFILATILFPIVATINVYFGRKIGSKKLSLYRQITLTIIGAPILIGLFSQGELLRQYWLLLILMWLCGATYLSMAFYAMNLTSVWVSRSFVTASRTVAGFLIGYFLFQESISFYDIWGIFIIFLWFYLLSNIHWKKLKRNDILWIIISLLAGVLFSINTLIFKYFVEDFSTLQAAYLLEASCMPFLLIFAILFRRGTIHEALSIEYKKLWILFLTAPLILLGSYGLAKSVNQIPFYIFNTLFVLTVGVSMILSFVFLKERLSREQLFALMMMLCGCIIVVLI